MFDGASRFERVTRRTGESTVGGTGGGGDDMVDIVAGLRAGTGDKVDQLGDDIQRCGIYTVRTLLLRLSAKQRDRRVGR